jgi:hypothetical protein
MTKAERSKFARELGRPGRAARRRQIEAMSPDQLSEHMRQIALKRHPKAPVSETPDVAKHGYIDPSQVIENTEA